MRNYIRAELYRSFNRLYFWVFTAFLASGELLLLISIKLSNPAHIHLTDIFDMTPQVLILPVFLVIAFIDMITAEEQKNLTLRNVVSFGLPRTKLILSKFITTSILAFGSALILLAVLYGSGAMLFGLGSTFPGSIGTVMIKFACSIPLWLGAIAIGTLIATLTNNNTIFAFTYLGIFGALPKILDLLQLVVSRKFKHVEDLLITSFIKTLQADHVTNHTLGVAVLAGFVYTIIFVILNVVYFNKKEIK